MSLKKFFQASLFLFTFFLGGILLAGDTVGELDEYWNRVSKAVRTGDLEAYRATCHQDGVLISGKAKKSELLSQALIRWGKEFADTKAGKMQADVKFRFSERIVGERTPHMSGASFYTRARRKERNGKRITFISKPCSLKRMENGRFSWNSKNPPLPKRNGNPWPNR